MARGCCNACDPVWSPEDTPLRRGRFGATNAVVAEGNFSGRLLFQGAGGRRRTNGQRRRRRSDRHRARMKWGAPFSIPVAAARRAAGGGARPPDRAQLYPLHGARTAPALLAEINRRDARRGRVDREPDPAGPRHAAGEVMVAMVTHEGQAKPMSPATLALLEDRKGFERASRCAGRLLAALALASISSFSFGLGGNRGS